MANWKKVIVSGSDASLNSLQATNGASITGSLAAANAVYLNGLSNVAQATIVGIDVATGQLYYQGTGSFTANSASYALSASLAESASFSSTASYVNTLNQAVVISGSLSVNTTTGNSFDINADTFVFTGSLSTTGSVFFALTEVSKSYVVGYDNTTGQLTYQTAVDNADTASFAVSASYALTASYAETASFGLSASFALTASYVDSLTQRVSITGSAAITGSGAALYVDAIYSGDAIDGSPDNRIFLKNPGGFGNPEDLVIYGSGGAVSIQNLGGAVKLQGGSGAADGVQITGSLKLQDGASGSFSGSFQGDGSQLTGVVASSAFSITGSTGISAFTYNGTSAAQVEISGAALLTGNTLTKWDGAAGAFLDSTITDNISGVTINNGAGVLIEQGGLYVTGASTFHNNVVFQGDITVQGTASFQNATDLAIADQFILLNSGSTTFQDSGIVINTGNSGNSGSAWFLETSGTTTGTAALNGRFAVASGVQPNATTVTADEYANTTKIAAIDPTTEVPQFGGTGLGQGNMWVNTENGEIYIYA